MKRIGIVTTMLGAILLSACTQTEPTPQAAQPAPTQQVMPTSALDMLSMTSEPTIAPTVVPRTTRKVERGTIDNVVVLSGQVVPLQYDLSFAQEGILKQLFIQPGQQIKQGDLIAELDLGDLETQLRQAQLTAKQDREQLARANQAGQLQVREAEINLETERAKLEELKSPPTSLEITKAQTALRQAQTALETTRNNVSEAKNLAYEEMIDAQRALGELRDRYAEAAERAQHPPRSNPNQPDKAEELQKTVQDLQTQVRQGEDRLNRAVISFDTARNNEVAAVQQGEAAVQAAQAEVDALLGGPDPAPIAEQERVIRRAELAVQQAQQQAAPEPSLQHAVQSDALQIEDITAQIKDRRLYASINGEVSTVNLAVGSPVQAGSSVATLVDQSKLELLADATDALAEGQTSLLHVNPGQPVQIGFSRYAGETFPGTITRVPATSNAGNTNYGINFETQNHEFSVGDVGTITIALGRKYDVLLVPSSAVHITADRTYVIIPNGDATRRVDVVTGIVTDTQVEIVRGLQEGDAVIDDQTSQ